MTSKMPAADHAALMDDVYRRQRFIYDLTRKYYLFGRDKLIRELALRPGERLIEIGCGTARNLVKIARRYPQAELFGLDASQQMLETAGDSLARAGLSGRVKLVHAYAEDLSPGLFGESAPFDRAVFSYSLSMIPDWRRALASAGASLAGAGTVHVVDFGDLTGLGPLAAKGLRAWLRLFHVEPRTEILHRLEELSSPGDGDLWVSPGRYAFLWTGSAEKASRPGGM
jgi:S-adenosylmethionine-diacylgycerolhomoserine-N-methlytransferase